MKQILITGANRGIGLGLTRHYLQRGDRVFSTCRNPVSANELQKLQTQYGDSLTIVQMDVTDHNSVESSVQTIKKHTNALDILINNAATQYYESSFEDITADNLRNTFEVNVIAPVIVAQCYLGLLRAGSNPVIVNISSGAGSISRRTVKHLGSYATSKTALNMLTKVMSLNLKEEGIAAIALHPGWVRTDMGGSNATLSIDESASGMLEVIDGLTLKDTGAFLQWNGEALPW